MFTVLWYSAIITCIVCFIPFLFFNWNSNKIYNKLVYGLLLNKLCFVDFHKFILRI